MQILIVEDDKFAAQQLLSLLKENDVGAQVTVAHSIQETRGFIRERQYDLIFLDVHLQDGVSTDIINELPANQDIIFVTGDPNYAVQAFEHNALDYLVKPVNKNRFLKTLSRIREKEEDEHMIIIRADYQFYRVRAEDILYVKSGDDYLTVVTEQQSYTFYERLKNFLAKLPQDKFHQCHRSYIVNIKKVSRYEKGHLIIRKSGIPVSGSFKKEIDELFAA